MCKLSKVSHINYQMPNYFSIPRMSKTFRTLKHVDLIDWYKSTMFGIYKELIPGQIHTTDFLQ